ncbi:MAG TPA: hypothetical protein VFU22_01960 [Roseiflexaceae bacterium]|nr:hypothetical protein [Roseiflexaceae bacterium]
MPAHIAGYEGIGPTTRVFYRHALTALLESDIPFLVGGGYAMAYYTGIARQTKDFDIFVKPADFERVLNVFAMAGYPTEVTFPSWLGKAIQGTDNIDVIFSSGNGLARVDETWFVPVAEAELFGITLKICPAEEIIWSKATIMGRERYDGADIAHILHARGQDLDWRRLLARFDSHWRVLLSHLILFGYIYPAERAQIPDWIMQKLLGAVQQEISSASPSARICRGTILSWDQYLVDVECHGYHDARLPPLGSLTMSDIAHFTAVLRGAKRAKLRPPIDTPLGRLRRRRGGLP